MPFNNSFNRFRKSCRSAFSSQKKCKGEQESEEDKEFFKNQARTLFFLATQDVIEDVREWRLRLERLAEISNFRNPEGTICKKFIEGIKPEIKEKLTAKLSPKGDSNNLSQVFKIAKKIEKEIFEAEERLLACQDQHEVYAKQTVFIMSRQEPRHTVATWYRILKTKSKSCKFENEEEEIGRQLVGGARDDLKEYLEPLKLENNLVEILVHAERWERKKDESYSRIRKGYTCYECQTTKHSWITCEKNKANKIDDEGLNPEEKLLEYRRLFNNAVQQKWERVQFWLERIKYLCSRCDYSESYGSYMLKKHFVLGLTHGVNKELILDTWEKLSLEEIYLRLRIIEERMFFLRDGYAQSLKRSVVENASSLYSVICDNNAIQICLFLLFI